MGVEPHPALPHLQPARLSLQSWTVCSISSSSASLPWEKVGVPDSGGLGLQMGYSLREGDTVPRLPFHRLPYNSYLALNFHFRVFLLSCPCPRDPPPHHSWEVGR